MDAETAPRTRIPLTELFTGFFKMGICGFGGMLPWARRGIVDQQRWLTQAEFNDLLALCQFLPGPNIIGMSLALGARFAGPLGAITCFTGLMAAPMAIIIGLGIIYAQFADVPVVQRAFGGLAAAASGMVLVTALKICAPLRAQPLGIAIAAVSFVVIAIIRVPLAPAMLGLAPAAILLVWMARKRTQGANDR